MVRIRIGLLGLCVMALGLMTFGAVSAQAENGAKWLILTSAGVLKTGAELHASVQLKTDVNAVLHTEILKIKTLFLCTTIEALNAKLQEEGIIGNTVVTNETTKLKEGRGSQIKFSGCTVDLNGAAAPECTPKDPVGGEGTMITKLAHALLELHELAADKVKDDVIGVLADSGETLMTIALPATCPIGTTVPVIGLFHLKDCENLLLTHLVEHLLEVFTPLTELFVISKTAEHAATLLGSFWARLTGEHAGLKWSGDPA